MKRINVKYLGSLLLFFLLAASQFVFADYPLRKDDTDPGSVTLGTLRAPARAKVVIPVTMDVVNGELAIFFNNSVGTAYISIQDANGNIVATDVLDTNASTEFYIPLDELEAGTYTLRVSYGTTKLIGEFVY